MKEFVAWSETLDSGVKEIDDQHKTLVNMLNTLNEAIHGGWGKEARREVIDKLIEYTKVHFAMEEGLMDSSNYPNSKAHKRQHEELIVMLKEHVRQYEQNSDTSSYNLIFFLKRWLTEHIMRDDKLLGKYLVKSGPTKGQEKKSLLKSLFGS